jgi:hypothetical protein
MGLFRIRTVADAGPDGAEYDAEDRIVLREDDDIRQMIIDLLVDENGYEAPEEKDPDLEEVEDEENTDDDVDGSFLRKLEIIQDGPTRWTTSEIPGIDSFNDGTFSIERIDVGDLQKKINKLILEFRSDPNDVDVLTQFIKGLTAEG